MAEGVLQTGVRFSLIDGVISARVRVSEFKCTIGGNWPFVSDASGGCARRRGRTNFLVVKCTRVWF